MNLSINDPYVFLPLWYAVGLVFTFFVLIGNKQHKQEYRYKCRVEPMKRYKDSGGYIIPPIVLFDGFGELVWFVSVAIFGPLVMVELFSRHESTSKMVYEHAQDYLGYKIWKTLLLSLPVLCLFLLWFV